MTSQTQCHVGGRDSGQGLGLGFVQLEACNSTREHYAWYVSRKISQWSLLGKIIISNARGQCEIILVSQATLSRGSLTCETKVIWELRFDRCIACNWFMCGGVHNDTHITWCSHDTPDSGGGRCGCASHCCGHSSHLLSLLVRTHYFIVICSDRA